MIYSSAIVELLRGLVDAFANEALRHSQADAAEWEQAARALQQAVVSLGMARDALRSVGE